MQRHSIKAILKTDKANDRGHHPIYIRITIDKKRNFISTGHYIHKSLWDKRGECVKSSHPDHADINTDIQNKKKELLNNLVTGSVSGKHYSASELKVHSVTAAVRNNFFLFSEVVIKEIKGKREVSTIENWGRHLLRLETYHGSRNLAFEQLNSDYLTAFEQQLREDGYTDNYMVAILKTIRRIVNVAIRKEVIRHNPFLHYEMPAYTPGNKEHLTLEELRLFHEYYYKATKKEHKAAIAHFLFGCYSGLRISDWYGFDFKKHVQDGYIRLRAKKNGEWVVVPIHNKLKEVLEVIKVHKLTARPDNLTTLLNKLAKKAGIEKHISSHSARKTFCITLCAERGISCEVAAELMGITLNVCVASYYRVTPAKINKEINEKWGDL